MDFCSFCAPFFSFFCCGSVLLLTNVIFGAMESASVKFESLGYHSCREDGSPEELINMVPFLSRKNNQWLGQGYYFWTDNTYWALKWSGGVGRNVVSEFKLSLDKSYLLDLVGDINDQILFKGLVSLFAKRFGGQQTISAVMSWLLEERDKPDSYDLFPYWAVKAKDIPRGVERYPFVNARKGDDSSVGYEELLLVERHQMCVYSAYKNRVVTFERFVHPPHFMESNGAIA